MLKKGRYQDAPDEDAADPHHCKVGAAPAPDRAHEQVPSTEEVDESSLYGKKKVELQEIAKTMGLSTGGSKKQLLNRILSSQVGRSSGEDSDFAWRPD